MRRHHCICNSMEPSGSCNRELRSGSNEQDNCLDIDIASSIETPDFVFRQVIQIIY